MAVYLKSLPAAGKPPLERPGAERVLAGETVYTTRCADCHQPTGLGVPQTPGAPAGKTAPPLVGNAALQAPDPATLINVILYGAHEAKPDDRTWPLMSGFELSVGLDDEQIAALCTYLRNAWGNAAGPVEAAAVSRQR
jgi:mono/diheme cytochrome c family protein